MKIARLVLVPVIVLLCAGAAQAQSTVSLLSQTFTRGNGKPVVAAATFARGSASAPFTLEVAGFQDNASTVLVNGVKVLGPGDFHGASVARLVDLAADGNTVSVQMAGKPGSTLTVTVTGQQVGYEFAADYEGLPLHVSQGRTAAVDWTSSCTAVKNEGDADAAWAFSVTGLLEAARKITGDGALISLSEQQMVDCVGPVNSVVAGLEWAMANGLPTEAAYPFTGVQGTCRTYPTPVTKAGPVVRATPGSIDALIDMLQTAPVSVVLRLPWLDLYVSGIANPTCEEGADDEYVPALIVGYNAAVGYFKIRMPFGPSWGESGYLRMSVAGAASCGLADYAVQVKTASAW